MYNLRNFHQKRKRMFHQRLGIDRLTSRNKAYDDIAGDENVRLVGKVIGKVVE